MRWVAPPGWPQPPAGWKPEPGWQPDPTWPPPPQGWRFWWESRRRRRPGIRGWAASLIPAAPPLARRSRALPTSRRRAWTEILGVFALFFGTSVVAAVLTRFNQPIKNPAPSISQDALSGLSELAIAGLAIVVVVALTKLRGVPTPMLGLAPVWSRRRAYRWQAIGMGLLFITTMIASSFLMQALTPKAHFPSLARSPWHLLFEIPAAINAGIVEELIVVALFVTAAEQIATRPIFIYVIGIGLRLSYHIYYGPGVIAFALWAATAIWLFRRCRRITPLIITHIIYDCLVSLIYEFPRASGPLPIIVVLLLFSAIGLALFRIAQIGLRARHVIRPMIVPTTGQYSALVGTP